MATPKTDTQVTKVVKVGAKRTPPAAGKGRKAGVPNKNTAAIKDMILMALENVGGIQYLESCAKDPKTSVAFLNLVGKVLPLQVTGSDDGPLIVQINRLTK